MDSTKIDQLWKDAGWRGALTILYSIQRQNVSSELSWPRAYSSRVIPSISIIENGMGVDSEILIKLAREGFKIEERNVAVTYGGDTSTFNPASHILRVLWSLTRGKYRRIRMIPTVGWIVAAGTLVTALVLLGLLKMPFSWFGLGASSLAFSIGLLAVALSPKGRLNRWIRKGKIARL